MCELFKLKKIGNQWINYDFSFHSISISNPYPDPVTNPNQTTTIAPTPVKERRNGREHEKVWTTVPGIKPIGLGGSGELGPGRWTLVSTPPLGYLLEEKSAREQLFSKKKHSNAYICICKHGAVKHAARKYLEKAKGPEL